MRFQEFHSNRAKLMGQALSHCGRVPTGRQAYTSVSNPETGQLEKTGSSCLLVVWPNPGSMRDYEMSTSHIVPIPRSTRVLSKWPEWASVQRLLINQESCHQKCVLGWEPSLMNRDEAWFSEHEYMSEMVKRSGYWVWMSYRSSRNPTTIRSWLSCRNLVGLCLLLEVRWCH